MADGFADAQPTKGRGSSVAPRTPGSAGPVFSRALVLRTPPSTPSPNNAVSPHCPGTRAWEEEKTDEQLVLRETRVVKVNHLVLCIEGSVAADKQVDKMPPPPLPRTPSKNTVVARARTPTSRPLPYKVPRAGSINGWRNKTVRCNNVSCRDTSVHQKKT